MLLSLNDQENAIHAQQTSKMQKSFNAPKTPGPAPKTPFPGRTGKKIGLNDENDLQKTMGKKTLGGKSSVFADAFVTPMGPRNRAPLGAKTTNAKLKANGDAFPGLEQTNKPAKTIQKIPRMRTPRSARMSVTELQPLVLGEKEWPEIEYMPPRAVELPYLPDDEPMPNFNILKEHMYKDVFRDEYASYAARHNRDLTSTEYEDQIIAEAEATPLNFGLGPLKRQSNALQPKSKTELNKKVLEKTDSKVGEMKKKLEAKRYNTATTASLKRRLPTPINTRPSSAAEKRAAALLSQPQTQTHKRSTSVVSSTRSKPITTISHKRAKSTVVPTNPKLAEVTSKNTVSYTAGREIADELKGHFNEREEDEFAPEGAVEKLTALWTVEESDNPLCFDDDDEDVFQIPMPVDDDE